MIVLQKYVRPFLLGLGVTTLVALAVGWQVAMSVSFEQAETADNLPTLATDWQPYDGTADMALLRQWQPWGEVKATAATGGGTGTDAWRFAGTVRIAAVPFAVILRDGGERADFVGENNPLPDGSTIIRIEQDRLFVQDGDQTRTFVLFAKGNP